MKIAMCHRVCAAFVLAGALTAPAFAQQTRPTPPPPTPTSPIADVPVLDEPDDYKFDISGAYMYVYDLSAKGGFPKGFISDVGFHVGPNAAFVAEVKGIYQNGGEYTDVLGGFRIVASKDKESIFMEGVAGISHLSGTQGTGNAWVFQPGGGLDWFGDGAAGIRLQASFVMNRNAGVWDKQVLLSAGIVFRK